MRKGFTLIELMVVVVIIGILAAIAIPNFIAMQERAKQSSVKGNMHTTQLAAEAFAVDYNSAYPEQPENSFAADGVGFAMYFPGGDPLAPTAGTYPNNPYTGRPMDVNSFNCRNYANTGDNAKATVGGSNDIQGPLFETGQPEDAGEIGFGTWPGDMATASTEYGIVGLQKDGKIIRAGNQYHLLHN